MRPTGDTMNPRRLLSALFVGAALMSLTGVAVAKGPGGSLGHLFHTFKEVNLTDAQKAQLKALRDDREADREAAETARAAIFSQLTAELAKDKPNKKAIYDLIDQEARSAAAEHKDRVDDLLAVQATMTPEQRSAFATALAAAHEGRGERRHEFKEAWKGHRDEAREEFKREWKAEPKE